MSIIEKLKKLIFGEPAPKRKTPAKPVTRDPYVYVTLRGKKFHYDICCPSTLNTKTYKMALSKARASGRTACDKCCYKYLHE